MGMAFHPDFPSEPWVYLVHSFGAEGGIRNRLIRGALHERPPRRARDAHRQHPGPRESRWVAARHRPRPPALGDVP